MVNTLASGTAWAVEISRPLAHTPSKPCCSINFAPKASCAPMIRMIFSPEKSFRRMPGLLCMPALRRWFIFWIIVEIVTNDAAGVFLSQQCQLLARVARKILSKIQCQDSSLVGRIGRVKTVRGKTGSQPGITFRKNIFINFSVPFPQISNRASMQNLRILMKEMPAVHHNFLSCVKMQQKFDRLDVGKCRGHASRPIGVLQTA